MKTYLLTVLGVCIVLLFTWRSISTAGEQESSTSKHASESSPFPRVVHREETGAPFVSAAVVSPTPDPDLEPGFPVSILHTSGTFYGGQIIHALVGNIDGDPQLEILTTGLAQGPLYAWNYDGSTVPGWPVGGGSGYGAAYPALGNIEPNTPELEVASSFFWGQLAVYSGSGTPLPGWPQHPGILPAPSLGDIDGDGIDEIFAGSVDHRVHGHRANGTTLPGWPIFHPNTIGVRRIKPTIINVDNDPEPEILTITELVYPGYGDLLAYNRDTTSLPWSPLRIEGSASGPVIGDVDADGQLEMVVAAHDAALSVRVLSLNGVLERTVPAMGTVSYGTAPALADIDGDGFPEIVLQADQGLSVLKGNGTILPGWPRTWDQRWVGNSAPVVGDVDGDAQPEIVITTYNWYSGRGNGEVRAYNRFGQMLPRFPKVLPLGWGAVPAIADIDLDGRNEIIIVGDYWPGITGVYDKVWVYDLRGGAHGCIEWGQYGGGPHHRDVYVRPTQTCVPASTATATAAPPTSTFVPPTNTPSATTTPCPTCPTATSTATPCPMTFTDVFPTDYFYEAVRYLYCAGVISGYADGTFRPYNNTTRGQLCKIVTLAEGWPLYTPPNPTFSDVPPTDPFYPYIETAYQQGVISGYADGTFRPQNNVTRGQLCKIVVLAEQWPLYTPPSPTFSDVPPQHTFYAHIETAYNRAIISGYADGTFRPGNNATRGQISKIVYNAITAP